MDKIHYRELPKELASHKHISENWQFSKDMLTSFNDFLNKALIPNELLPRKGIAGKCHLRI